MMKLISEEFGHASFEPNPVMPIFEHPKESNSACTCLSTCQPCRNSFHVVFRGKNDLRKQAWILKVCVLILCTCTLKESIHRSICYNIHWRDVLCPIPRNFSVNVIHIDMYKRERSLHLTSLPVWG